MEKSRKYKIEVINFDVYKKEIIKLREQSWSDFHSKNLIKGEFYSQQDKIEDLSSIHCGIIENNKLVATHRLQIINSIEQLPYSENFEPNTTIGSNWCTYKEEKNQYVVMIPPVAATGRLAIHVDYRKKGIPEDILNFWIKTARERGIKTLIAYPSPWIVKTLLKVGFRYEKKIKNVFKPLPLIDLVIVTMKF
jgi:GNAT superfamily N-acetyltransferase|tara:strand:+ start:312 stop:890 length:579 start_codon:yes stop_codon:yes gene_type:complete